MTLAGDHALTLFELSPDLLVVVDSQRIILTANPAWERILGRRPKDLVGTSITDLLHPDDQRRADAIAAALRAGRMTTGYESRMSHADGSYRRLRWSARAITEEGLVYGAARDVTYEHVAMERLNEAVLRLEEAQRIAALGSWEFRPRDGRVSYTPEMFRLMGLPTSAEPPSVDAFLSMLDADDLARHGEGLGDVMQHGGETASDVRLIHAPGHVFHLHVRATQDADGNVLLVRGTLQDVTEVRGHELELAQSERRLEEAQADARMGSYEFDPRTGDAVYTPQMFKLFGLVPGVDDTFGADEFFAALHPEDRERVRAVANHVLTQGGNASVDVRLVSAPDTVLHLRVGVETDADGRPVIARGTAQDITAFRAQENALRLSESQLAEAERIAGLGSFEVRTTDGFSRWSAGTYRLFGLPADRAPLSGEEFYALMDPADATRAHNVATAALARGEPFTYQVRQRGPDGRTRHLACRGEEFERDGVTWVRGTLQDVTRVTRAARQQEALARLGQLALEGTDVDELAQAVCRAVAQTIDADMVSVARLAEDGLEMLGGVGWPEDLPRTLSGAELGWDPDGRPDPSGFAAAPRLVDDWLAETRFPYPMPLRESGVRSTASLPIPHRGQAFGHLSAHSRLPNAIGPDDFAFLDALASMLAATIERLSSQREAAELAELRGRLVAETVTAEERARRRISEALHDGALQDLLAARQDLVEAESATEGREELIRFARSGVEHAVRQLREAVAALHPMVLQHGGLGAALQAASDLASRHGGFTASVDIQGDPPTELDELVLSLARELLTNAAKHADATSVRTCVRLTDHTLVLEVTDDGRGLDPEAVAAAPRHGHIGLASLVQRVEAVGGTVDVDAGPGRGTTVRAELPID